MKLKIFAVNTTSESAVEEEINSWLEGKEFSHLQIAQVVDLQLPRVGTKVYVIYEEALQSVCRDLED